jgi:hypothetical protein
MVLSCRNGALCGTRAAGASIFAGGTGGPPVGSFPRRQGKRMEAPLVSLAVGVDASGSSLRFSMQLYF